MTFKIRPFVEISLSVLHETFYYIDVGRIAENENSIGEKYNVAYELFQYNSHILHCVVVTKAYVNVYV